MTESSSPESARPLGFCLCGLPATGYRTLFAEGYSFPVCERHMKPDLVVTDVQAPVSAAPLTPEGVARRAEVSPPDSATLECDVEHLNAEQSAAVASCVPAVLESIAVPLTKYWAQNAETGTPLYLYVASDVDAHLETLRARVRAGEGQQADDALLWSAFEAGHFAWPTAEFSTRRRMFDKWKRSAGLASDRPSQEPLNDRNERR